MQIFRRHVTLMPVEWTKDVLPWAPPALTVLGWYLVNKQSNAREVRKEMRSASDRCKALARESVLLGMQYWAGAEGVEAWQVKVVLDELDIELCRFPERQGRMELLEKHADLLDAITGDDFESSTPKARSSEDPVMRKMSKARQRLLVEIEHQFEKHYC
ncbi:hypothetical protein [Hydrogenophaga sp. 2FB]|uniref:hypothetical protein n=1 Tax=Hydrogenophaga sp. 2FB TaxID=2502187 RepID=UPI001BB13410|nr:hypothetical protein [Hydrogenophaga sp. 2FB]